MEFGILGPVRVCRPEGPVRLSGKQRAVISVFLLHPNTPISRDRLIASLWDDPPRSAPANIQTYVHQLRRALSGTALRVRTEGSGYTCELPPDQLDLLAFDQAVRRGRQERARGDLAAAEREYAAAMALWRGTPAQDVPLGSAMTARLAELEERFEVARSEWIDLRLALGGDDLVAELRTLVAGHPLRERLWEQLMTALYAGGRRDEALATFREARALLVAELGVEPGRELTRLHAAILAGTPLQEPDRPLPRRTLCRLPADTADFVGRTAELEALLPVMRAREDRLGPPIAVVSGLPGVGKTAFAVHLAHLLRPDYPDGQLFVHLGRHRGPAELLGELLRCLGVEGTLVPGPVEERAGMLRQRLADLAVLIVLDDADDETQVRHLLPGTARGAVLVTSRSSLPALEGATRLPLGLPSESEARQLLERVAGRDRIGAAPRAAEEILRTCGRLPLAIRVAGARLATRPVWPVREFATRLADRGLDELVVGGLDVRATFEPGYAALPPPAARAFRLLGLAGQDSVAEWSVAALLGVSGLEADAALETLVSRGMLDSTEVDAAGQPRYRLHDLLRVYAGERAEGEEPSGDRHAALAAHARECLRRVRAATRRLPISVAPPYADGVDGEPAGEVGESIAWLSAERRALVRAVETAASLGEVAVAAELAHHLTGYLTIDGFLDDVERVQRAVVEAARAAGDERTVLRARLLVASNDTGRGRIGAAAAELEALLVAFERIGDPHGAAYALVGRAACRRETGRLAEALADARAAIHLLSGLDDPAGLDYAWTWPIWIHVEQGEYGLAETICRDRLTRTRDDDHVIRSNLLRALGTCLYLRGEAGEAVTAYRESLLLSRGIGDRVETSKSLRRLGEALGALGRFTEAAQALQDSLRLFGECGNPVGQALAMHALAVVRLRQSRPRDALDLLRDAGEGLGPDGPGVWRGRILREQAQAHADLGDPHTAAELRRQAFALLGDGPEASALLGDGSGASGLLQDDGSGASGLLPDDGSGASGLLPDDRGGVEPGQAGGPAGESGGGALGDG